MGRASFQHLLTAVKDPGFLDGSSTLYLYGPSGTGKSHLLAALVFYLVRNGERVLFIPDCRSLLTHLLDQIKQALLFAFHDDLDLCDEINRACHIDDIVLLVSAQHSHTFYIVVDQRNALDSAGPGDMKKHAKEAALDTIDKLRASQRYIFSASANQQSDRDSERRQSEIKTILFRAGLNHLRPYLFVYFVSCSPRRSLSVGSTTINTLYPFFLPKTASSSKTLLVTSPFCFGPCSQ
jgi:hypothetical protein